jgi:hypothetical protein
MYVTYYVLLVTIVARGSPSAIDSTLPNPNFTGIDRCNPIYDDQYTDYNVANGSEILLAEKHQSAIAQFLQTTAYLYVTKILRHATSKFIISEPFKDEFIT